MELNRFDVWMANMNPSRGTEVGKVRPVLIVQSDYINAFHHSTLVCPFSSSPWIDKTFHLFIPKDLSGIELDSVILLDQLRAVDNRKLIKKIGVLPGKYHERVNESLKIILDLI